MSREALMRGVAAASVGAVAVVVTFTIGGAVAAWAGNRWIGDALAVVARVAMVIAGGTVPVMAVELRRRARAPQFEGWRCSSCHRPVEIGQDHWCPGFPSVVPPMTKPIPMPPGAGVPATSKQR